MNRHAPLIFFVFAFYLPWRTTYTIKLFAPFDLFANATKRFVKKVFISAGQ